MSENEQQQLPPKQYIALVPIEEKTVDFYGDSINAALVNTSNGQQQVYVPLRPICDYLGLNWSGQYLRVKRDPVLSEVQGVCIMQTPSSSKRSGGGPQQLLCLPLDYLNGWLFGVNATRVKPDLREKVIRYQRECYRVLWQAFQEEALIFGEQAGLAQEYQPSAALLEIREMGLAIARMAEQQIELERLARSAHSRLDQAAIVVRDLRQRLGAVEQRLAPPAYISEAQATEVSQRVRALAELLTSQGPNENHYQGVFAELYRRFGVNGYRQIRLSQYEQVLEFLESWRNQVDNTSTPGE
jgi:hypothetical protein